MEKYLLKYLSAGQEQKVENLIKTIGGKKSLALIGSGLSVGAGYPTWDELVNELVTVSGLNPIDLQNIGLIETVEKCKSALGINSYYDSIRKIFDESDAKKLSYSPSLLQIMQMPFLSFPTTNIDNCHINARNKISSTTENDFDVQPDLNTELLRDKRIYYLHGKIYADEKIRSIVLSKSEYDDAYRDGIGVKEFLLRVLRKYDCIFIGYSMNDPFINKMIDDAKNNLKQEKEMLEAQNRTMYTPQHFVFLPDYSDSTSSSNLTDDEIYDQQKLLRTEKELFDMGVISIKYKAFKDIRLKKENHNALYNFIDQLHSIFSIKSNEFPH